LRRFVQWSAAAMALAGVAVIASLDAPVAARLSAVHVWCVIMACQVGALRRSWGQCAGFRVHADGSVEVRNSAGEWRCGQLEPDGVLLRRWAWIRLRKGSGRPFAEPLRGSCRDSREWRRLQVVWRHVGA
jgi:hypothetical protein